MKRSRQKAILTILNQRRITTQEQLRDALLEQGIRVTRPAGVMRAMALAEKSAT